MSLRATCIAETVPERRFSPWASKDNHPRSAMASLSMRRHVAMQIALGKRTILGMDCHSSVTLVPMQDGSISLLLN